MNDSASGIVDVLGRAFRGKGAPDAKVQVIVRDVISLTPCGRHAWLRTNVGRIRKPVGTFEVESLIIRPER